MIGLTRELTEVLQEASLPRETGNSEKQNHQRAFRWKFVFLKKASSERIKRRKMEEKKKQVRVFWESQKVPILTGECLLDLVKGSSMVCLEQNVATSEIRIKRASLDSSFLHFCVDCLVVPLVFSKKKRRRMMLLESDMVRNALWLVKPKRNQRNSSRLRLLGLFVTLQ